MIRTSLSHPLQIATVSAGPGLGQIGLTFCPGKKDPHAMTGAWNRDLGLDLKAVADWGAAAVVSLVEHHELANLGVPHLGEAVIRHHMDWLHLPIPDVSVPDNGFEAAWTTAGEGLRARLRDGAGVLVHCKGGLGRSGLIAARLLIELGHDPDAAVAAVRKARPGAIETGEQLGFVKRIKPVAESAPDRSSAAIRNRAIGALLGLAVGDAVGTTLEFKSRDDAAAPLRDMVGGGPFGLAPGQWTDDTAMALALADSFAADSKLDERDLLDRFVSWWKAGTYSCTGTCFDIGGTTRRALSHYLATGDTQDGPAGTHDAGNGSLMRLSPVAIRHWNDPDLRRDIAARQSRTTHGAAEAVDACVLYAELIAEAIAGLPRSAILAPRQHAASPKIAAIASGAWRSKPRTAIRGSGYVVDALEAALWCVARTASFEDAVLLAANLRDDADTTAAITGQLAGALYGASAIPTRWTAKLAWRERIVTMAEALFDGSV